MDNYNFFIKIFKHNIPDVSDEILYPSYFEQYKCPYEFHRGLVNDIFLSDIFKTILVSVYRKSYNIYKIFINRINYIKKKKGILRNTFDFTFTDFTSNDTNVITIFHKSQFYKFRLKEINDIWAESLLKDQYMFPCPRTLTNPYTNIPFTKNILYKIFYTLNNSSCIINPVITLYFNSNMNILIFKETYEGLLQDLIIKNYALKSRDDEFWKYEYESFISYIQTYMVIPQEVKIINLICNWIQRLVDPIRKYLHYYLIIRYSKICFRKDIFIPKLITGFREFLRTNITYARITVRARRRK